RPHGEHEEVVPETAVDEHDLPRRRIDGAHLVEQDPRVTLPTQDRADRVRDVVRRERRGRDLVEQRLKEMMIPPVDERHAYRSASEPSRRIETAEPAADDHDLGKVVHRYIL